MKKLTREYGWSALGVYAMLSVLDFPFCYMLVMALGTERIGEFGFLLSIYVWCGKVFNLKGTGKFEYIRKGAGFSRSLDDREASLGE